MRWLDYLSPMLLSERKTAFSDSAWSYELKFDGYRLLAEVDDGRCTLRSRNGADATTWFPEVVSSLAKLPGHQVFDGEVSVLDDIGRSDFDRLHARARRRGLRPGFDPVVFCAFDALVVDGRDVMPESLSTRKAELRRLLANKPASVLYVQGIEGEGEALYQHALGLKLEGIVAKRLASPYVPGSRSRDWLKIKRPGAVPPERFKRGSR